VTTVHEFLPPRSLPTEDALAQLRAGLDSSRDVVAAYYVTARYPEQPPCDAGAPFEVFRELGAVVPGGIVFTFPPTSVLSRVREAGTLRWARRDTP
jgi:hypothetical protein